MTAISWKNGVNGDWSTAADWSGGTVPQSTDTVTIAATGTYTLTITAAEAAASVTLAAAGAILADSSSLAVGTAMLVSAGTLALSSGGSVTGGTLTVSRLGSLLATGADSISSAIADTGAIDVASGTLSLTGGGSLGGTLSGAGTLLLGGGTYTTGGGTFASTGTLAIDGAELGGPGTIALGGTTTILDAGGQVAAFIGGNAVWQNSSVVNDGGLIEFGAYGDTGNTIANQAGAQFNFTDDDASLNAYGGPYGTATFTNAGTLAKTSGTGTSTIDATLNTTGLIKVASGTIDLLGGGSLGGSLSGAGTLLLGEGTYTTAGGTFASTGTLAIDGAELGGTGTIAIAGTTTILDNGGSVAAILGGNAVWQNSSVVNDGGLIDIGAYGDTGNTFLNKAGAQFNLTDNDAALNANGGPYGTATFTNAGTLAKTSGTGTSTIDATLNNTGLIKVASGTLDLEDGGALGGTLSGAGTLALGAGTFTSNGGTLLGTGNLAINDGANLSIAAGKTLALSDPLSFGLSTSYNGAGYLTGPGTLTTTGATTINSYYANPEAYLGGDITWVNGGTVNDAGTVYINTVSNDTDAVTIINQAGANFDLTSGNAYLELNYNGADVFSNAGTLAATSGVSGVSGVIATIGISVNNTGLISVASGATLDLDGGGSLGGTLSGAGTLALGGGTFTSNGGTLLGTGNLAIDGSADLAIAAGKTLALSDPLSFGLSTSYNGAGYLTGPGTLTTTGTTTINSYYTNPEAYLGGGITWVNSGTVNDAGAVYINTVSNDTDTVTIINQAGANFDLTSGNAYLELNYNGADVFSNAGTLAATSGVSGTIATIGIAVNNTGLISVASGATLDLNGGGSLGGTLSGAGTLVLGPNTSLAGGELYGTGNLSIAGYTALTPDSATYTITANVFVNDIAGIIFNNAGDDLTLAGSLTIGGTGQGYDDAGYLAGPGTLTTTGVTTITDAGNGEQSTYIGSDITWVNYGTVNDAGVAYVNNMSNDDTTIINEAGASFNLTSGDATLTPNLYYAPGTYSFENRGTLSSTGGTGVASVNMSVDSTGLIEVASGTLALDSTVSNAGKMLATGGGVLTLASATLSNLPGTTLTGGAYEADAGSIIELANNASIAIDSASITLSGAGSAIEALNTGTNAQITLDSTLGSIAAGGTLALASGRNFTAVANHGTFATSGLLSLGGVTFGATKLTIAGSGSVSGSGTVSGSVANLGHITASGGKLALTGAVSGGGVLSATSGAVIDFYKGGTLSGSVSGLGTLQLDGAAATVLAGASVTVAAIKIDAGATLSGTGSIAGSVADAGTLAASGGTLLVSGAVSGAGALQAAAGAVLDLAGGGTLSGAIGGAGILQIDGNALVLQPSASLSVAGVKIDAGATLNLQYAGSLGGTMSGAGTLKLDGSSYALAAGTTLAVGTILLDAGVTLAGAGTLSGAVNDAGTLAATGGTLLVDGAITGAGALSAAAGAVLDLAGGGSLAGAITGAGTLQIDGASPLVLQAGASLAAASVLVDAGATLDLTQGGSLAGSVTGAGTLQLDGATAYSVSPGAVPGVATLRVDAGATLSGAGNFAGALIDAGTVAASGGTLVLGAVTGAGALSAAAGASLELTAGGALSEQISGAGTLQLDTAPYSLAGGTLGVGAVAVDAGATLTGSGTVQGALTDAGSVTASGGTLTLGAVSGAGTLSAAAAATLDLTAGGSFTEQIAGAGTLQLDSARYMLGTVLGIGSVLIDAGASLAGAGTLTGALTDNGALLASSGTLAVQGQVSGTGSFVIAAGATLDCLGGGTLAGAFSGAGLLQLDDAAFVLQAGEDILAGGVAVDAGASLSGAGTIDGTLTDNGSVAATPGTTLAFLGPVTGTGSLSAGLGAVLDLKAGGALTELITGAGTLALQGTGAYTMSGESDSIGTVVVAAGATVSGFGALTGALQNSGTVTATGGKLVVGGAISGPGVLAAAAGATLDLAAGGSLTETVSGAGTLEFGGVTTLGTAHLAVADVVIDAGASISAVGTLTSIIQNSGTLSVLGGRLIATGAVSGAGALSAGSGGLLLLEGGGTLSGGASGAGTLELFGTSAYTLAGSTTFDTASLVVASNAHVSGSGSIAGALADSGVLTASGGKLVVAGSLTGTGALAAASGAVLDLTAGGTLSQAVSGAGTLELSGAYLLGTKLPTVTAMRIDASGSLSGTGSLASAIDDLGTLTATSGTLAIGGILSGSGTLSAAAGALLDLAKGGSFAGAITGGGTIDIAGALTLGAGATLAAANLVATASVTLGASASVTNAAADDFTLDAASGKIVALNGPATASFTNDGSLTANGSGTADVGVALINAANVLASSGTLAFLAGVTNAGTIDVSAGVVSFSKSVAGTGTLEIGASGTLGLLAGAGTGEIVDFLAGTGLLNLTAPTSFHGTIDGFGASEAIDLLKTPETSFTFANGILTVKDGTRVEATLNFGGTYTQSDFTLGTDGSSGTLIKFL